MKYLFFLSHPAHFHLFKNTINYLKNTNDVEIVIKSKDILAELLENEGWKYHNAQKKKKNANGKIQILLKSIFGLLKRDIFLFGFCRKYKPDILIGTEWAIVHVGKLLRIPSVIVNEDDTIATPENKYFYPLASTLLLPKCCDVGLWEDKRVSYSGYHELAYLHPDHFKPNPEIVEQYGLKPDSYYILRFVQLSASHDTGKDGFSIELQRTILNKLLKSGKVYITSEKELDPEFEPYRLAVNPLDIHHILAYAKIYIGDSQTMAAEAGVLGTPFIRYNDFVGKISYLDELENKYEIGYGFKTGQSEEMLSKIDELLNKNNIESEWKDRLGVMLSENINVAKFMTNFFETYPESIKENKANH